MFKLNYKFHCESVRGWSMFQRSTVDINKILDATYHERSKVSAVFDREHLHVVTYIYDQPSFFIYIPPFGIFNSTSVLTRRYRTKQEAVIDMSNIIDNQKHSLVQQLHVN